MFMCAFGFILIVAAGFDCTDLILFIFSFNLSGMFCAPVSMKNIRKPCLLVL